MPKALGLTDRKSQQKYETRDCLRRVSLVPLAFETRLHQRPKLDCGFLQQYIHLNLVSHGCRALYPEDTLRPQVCDFAVNRQSLAPVSVTPSRVGATAALMPLPEDFGLADREARE